MCGHVDGPQAVSQRADQSKAALYHSSVKRGEVCRDPGEHAVVLEEEELGTRDGEEK